MSSTGLEDASKRESDCAVA